LIWKKPYYDKFLCHKLQEGYFGIPRRFCADSNSEMLDPLFPFGRPSKTSEPLSVSNIRLDDLAIPSKPPSVSRSFKVAFVRTSWQHVRTLFRVREVSNVPIHPSGRRDNTVQTLVRVRGELGFPLQKQIWEDSYICPDVRSTPSGRYP